MKQLEQYTSATEDFKRLIQGRHHDPFSFLGIHPINAKTWIIRAWMPTATSVRIESGPELEAIGEGLFALLVDEHTKEQIPQHYTLEWSEEDGSIHQIISSYTFAPQIGDVDLYLLGEGRHWHMYDVLGANPCTVDGVEGVLFGVWAPSAERISVVGNFNVWNGKRHPMRCRGNSGVWELFIPGIGKTERYKFEIRNKYTGDCFVKADPCARAMEMRPRTASIVHVSEYVWSDADWMQARRAFDWQHKPVSIYEVHLGSWQVGDSGRFLNYREIAHRLVEYALWMGFTHLNLMPVSEHALDESWGYQVTAYYAPTRRFGDPDDFRYFVDYCHQHNLGVFLDWVPAHFPKDRFALARFDGTALYEHEDPRIGEHREWGTYVFNYGRNEVRNFLIANALYWLSEFHIDGLRVDAVASMLYLDYSRDEGESLTNAYGGNENIEAIEFLRTLNTEIHARYPGAVLMAEESTSWPMVSRPVWMGGLGFSMKWNMGWMNDTLDYFAEDPIHRSYSHSRLTFSQLYAYHENFILPLSHDEVVHQKRSLLDKMPGDRWQKFANLRLLFGYQMLHPGKKLLFMGGEFGQWREWNDKGVLDWHLCEEGDHRGVQILLRELNQLYASNSALYAHDFESCGFEWIDCNDNKQSILSFVRRDTRIQPARQLVCLFNFTPVVRHGYRIGMPRCGTYSEIINSDAAVYGGSNTGNSGAVHTESKFFMGRDCSAVITLPPLAFIILQLEE
ncbi:MAG: 1,4-alpha-glucan branching protein GlgB [Desulfuromonadaceae bacterium]|nr:1,4-alpha-glucan branching protein GlgB [Desulfuromonas sp.]MDY0184521.1 1,4-alpha-glucan branching protein GlgB [Desulfuromonadaceae bacterium]